MTIGDGEHATRGLRAIIGDCETVALVSRRGSVDWLLWPRFDFGACFAGLLGTAEHGRLVEAQDADAQATRRYRPNTPILETTIETRSGTVTVIDFMPLRGRFDVVRLSAAIAARWRCAPSSCCASTTAARCRG